MTTYSVTGLTCEHCARAVRSEIGALPGVSEVDVDLVAGGISRVRVEGAPGAALPDDAALQAALDEAGDYHLQGPAQR